MSSYYVCFTNAETQRAKELWHSGFDENKQPLCAFELGNSYVYAIKHNPTISATPQGVCNEVKKCNHIFTTILKAACPPLPGGMYRTAALNPAKGLLERSVYGQYPLELCSVKLGNQPFEETKLSELADFTRLAATSKESAELAWPRPPQACSICSQQIYGFAGCAGSAARSVCLSCCPQAQAVAPTSRTIADHPDPIYRASATIRLVEKTIFTMVDARSATRYVCFGRLSWSNVLALLNADRERIIPGDAPERVVLLYLP